MEYRKLGSTGLRVSVLAFGAGPVSGLMTGAEIDRQAVVVRRAIEAGINWFDTAATYGGGRSEESLGAVLKQLGQPAEIHIATKARLMPEDLGNIGESVRESLASSLARLGLQRITLLQLHNSITRNRGDEPTSITPDDVLGKGGVLEAFESLRAKGLVDHLGLTGIGQPEALRDVVNSGSFATMQIPYHVLNPSAGRIAPQNFTETNHGNVIADCAAQNMGVFAIRVFAAGALLDLEPSAHTLKTPFFPLALYKRDRRRAALLAERLGQGKNMQEFATRFALSHPAITSAIIGFGEPAHIDEALRGASGGPLPPDELQIAAEFLDKQADPP
jgi:aryl-alcohol dehydrogenase-like predicted oxidoreductase